MIHFTNTPEIGRSRKTCRPNQITTTDTTFSRATFDGIGSEGTLNQGVTDAKARTIQLPARLASRLCRFSRPSGGTPDRTKYDKALAVASV